MSCSLVSPRIARAFGMFLGAVLSIGIAFTPAFAQGPVNDGTATPVIAPFDVVSIKQNKSIDGGMSIAPTDSSYRAVNVSLHQLIANAYFIRSSLVFGLPGWADSEAFDVDAKIVDPNMDELKKLSFKQKNFRIAMFLSDRFHLKVHTETRIVPVYELVIAKSGPKFKTEKNTATAQFDLSKLGDHPGSGVTWMSNDELVAKGISMRRLGESLEDMAGRPIIDKTGLTGVYDIQLKWGFDKPDDAGDVSAPVFTALQDQLGLKLQVAKGPMEVLVVDHVEQPTEN